MYESVILPWLVCLQAFVSRFVRSWDNRCLSVFNLSESDEVSNFSSTPSDLYAIIDPKSSLHIVFKSTSSNLQLYVPPSNLLISRMSLMSVVNESELE